MGSSAATINEKQRQEKWGQEKWGQIYFPVTFNSRFRR